jgi:diacylglycerol O-acyltransferase
MAWYERLSAQDASFLVYEDRDPSAHMHVGGVSVYEAGALSSPRGGVDVERFRTYVASRLHMIPRYRQRLASMPLSGDPIWIDDDHFNVRYHIRHTRLPRPGDERELKRLGARIMSQRLDRRRPLWELWLIEGLPDGRFALVTKTHHCMIDGVSGVDISTVLMQMSPDETAIAAAPPWQPRPAPTTLSLALDEIRMRARVPLDLAAAALPMLRDWRGLTASVRANLAGLTHLMGLAWQGAAQTPLNRPIGPHRRFDWTDVDLAEAKAIKNRLGGTLNDVVLTVVTGALHAFLRRRRINVDILDFVAAIPVNIRLPGDHEAGTKVAAWFAPLPVDERDAAQRFARVHATTTTLKEQAHADPTVHLFKVADIGGPAALNAVVVLEQTMNPSNLIVTNVPGPPFPLFILGSRMLAAYPLVTLLANQALGIAVLSYDGRLQFGLNADWDIVPDLHDLVLDVERSFAELRRAAGLEAPASAPSTAAAESAVSA